MTQQTLQTAQYNKLRSGRYAGTQLIKLFSNRVVLHGTITTDLSAVTNWASFGYTTISGSYTNCLDNQVLVICATDDVGKGANSWYGRLRGAPGSGTITCNESSDNFSPGAYFWVLDTFAAQYIYSRPSTNDPLTALELVNYDQSYQGILPSMVGLPFCIGGYPVAATGKFRYAFDLSGAVAMQSGATIASYLTTFPSGTLVTGSLSTPYFVMDFSAGEQWGKVTVTDSNGLTLTRHVGIQVLDDSTNPPDVKTKGATITSQLDQGVTMTLPAFGGVDSVLNNTLVMAIRTDEQLGSATDTLWGGGSATVTNKALTSNTATITAVNTFKAGEQVVVVIGDSAFDGTYIILSANSAQFTYHKVHADVASTGASGLAVVNPQNVDFVGWYQRETDPITPDAQQTVISTATFTFTGIGPRMQRLGAQLLALVQTSSPALWGDINALTPWRAIWHFLSRYTTLAGLVDVSFDDYTGAFQFPAISTQGGNVHSVVAGIAKQITAYMEFNPTGSVYIARSATYLNAFQRLSLPVNGNWTTSDVVAPGGLSRDYQPNSDTGKVDWTGAFYNTSSGAITSYTSRAPGIAAGEGAGTDTTADQILLATTDPSAALTELKQRVGARLLEMNNNETLDAEHPAAYATIPIVVSRSTLYSWALDANVAGTHGVNRVVYTSSQYWLVENTTMQFNEDRGYFTTKVKYRILVPVASPGDDTTQNIPAQGEIQNTIPDFTPPAFNWQLPEVTTPDVGSTNPASAPPLPSTKALWLNGMELIAANAAKIFWLKNFIALTTPQANDITPPSGASTTITNTTPTNWYPAWTLLFGTYSPGNGPSGDDAVFAAYSRFDVCQVCDITELYNFPSPVTVTDVSCWRNNTDGSNQSFQYIYLYSGPNGTGSTLGFYSNTNFTTGWQQYVSSGLSVANVRSAQFIVEKCGITPAFYMARPSITYTYTSGTTWSNVDAVVTDLLSASSLGCGAYGLVDDTTNSIMFYTSNAAVVSPTWTSGAQLTGLYRVARLGNAAGQVFAYSPSNGGNAKVSYSSDYGVTWNTLTVGTTPGSVGGFDSQRAGTVSYAAAAGALYKATTFGGAYSSWYSVPSSANPVVVIIPYYRRNSSTLNISVSDPDVIIGCDNGKWYWLNGTAATATDITPVASLIPSNADCLTVRYGNELACWGTVGGLQKVYTSTDGGGTWTLRSTITSGGKIRCRRDDSRPSPNGQIFLAQNNVIDYSSKWFSNALYPRYMPQTGMTMFDTVV